MAGLVLRTYGPRMVRGGPRLHPINRHADPCKRSFGGLRKSKVLYGGILRENRESRKFTHTRARA